MLAEWWQLVAEQPVPAGEPMEAKLELARLIVRRSHGEDAVQDAEAHFTRVVREHGAEATDFSASWSGRGAFPLRLSGGVSQPWSDGK